MDNISVQRILQAVKGRRVVVLGDLMLDEWVMGDASRISPEAPVPVVRFAQRMTAPGGAANVAMNLLSLGAEVCIVGVVGDDEGGRNLTDELNKAGVQTGGVVKDASRCTTQKTRIMAQRQQMVRVDRETEEPFSPEVQSRLRRSMEEQLQAADLLCISDYDKGLATSGLMQWAIAHAAENGKKITAGPKPQNSAAFQGAGFASLNEKEANIAAGVRLTDDAALRRAGEQLRAQSQWQALAITLGARGAMLFEEGKPPHPIPAHEVEVFDVAGAGDTFLAASTLGILAGVDNATACVLGNRAAAASVRHVGVVAVTGQDLVELEVRS